MELCGFKHLHHIQNIEGEHLHHIQNIKGRLVTKVLNVSHGRPKLSFKSITDIHEHESLFFDNDDAEAVRSCVNVMEEGTVKTKPHDWVCDTNDGNVQRFHNLDDDNDCAILTLKQIKESCKARKRKRSQVLNSSKIKIKTEDLLMFDDCMETQQMKEDPDLLETLSNFIAKQSKNMKTKKKTCIKDHPMPTQEIVLVEKSEEVLDGPEFSPSSGNSATLVEMNFECLENCFDGPDDCSSRESKDAEITLECNLKNVLSYKWKGFMDYIPLRVVTPSGMDIVISNSELSSNQSSNFPAIEFEDHDNYYIFDNQLNDETDIPVSPPQGASHKDLDSIGLEVRHDNTLLGDCGEDEYTAGAEVQEKPCSTMEHGLNPDGYLVYRSDDSPEYEGKQSLASLVDDDTGTPVSPSKVTSHKDLGCETLEIRADNSLLEDCCKDENNDVAEVQYKLCSTIEHGLNPDGCLVHRSDDSPEYEEKQSVISLYDGESIHAYESTDELTSCDEHKGSSKLHGPERLLSTRKAISLSSLEKLCKAIDINHKKNQKCKGELQFTEQTDSNGDAEDFNDMTRTGVTNNPKKIKFISKTTKNGSNLKGVSKIRNSSRSATRMGCSTLQNCSKNAIAFSKQQMQDAENLTMKLTKELKSMKDIVNDMLRSEFCLNTSLRYKVNKARMAVKSATKAEEGAKRWLSFMSRDCNRFCKIMKLADSSPSTPQDVVRKEKKIAFADEAGGKLCQVRFYEDDVGHLSEPK